MGKKTRRKRRGPPRTTPPETDPGLLATYLSDPIALWQDREYEALDALYAQPDGPPAASDDVKSGPAGADRTQGDDDEIPF